MCQNDVRPQLGLKGIQFGQLQTVAINWGDQPNPGAALSGDALQQVAQVASQLRPYMAPMGKMVIGGLTVQNALIDFCNAARLPAVMVQLNGDGRSITGWTGPITFGGGVAGASAVGGAGGVTHGILTGL